MIQIKWNFTFICHDNEHHSKAYKSYILLRCKRKHSTRPKLKSICNEWTNAAALDTELFHRRFLSLFCSLLLILHLCVQKLAGISSSVGKLRATDGKKTIKSSVLESFFHTKKRESLRVLISFCWIDRETSRKIKQDWSQQSDRRSSVQVSTTR